LELLPPIFSSQRTCSRVCRTKPAPGLWQSLTCENLQEIRVCGGVGGQVYRLISEPVGGREPSWNPPIRSWRNNLEGSKGSNHQPARPLARIGDNELFTVGYGSAQRSTSLPPQPTSSSPLHPTQLPLGYVRLPPGSVYTPLHVRQWDPKISPHNEQGETGAKGRKLTVPLFCESKRVSSKHFSTVVADTERFLSPVFTWVSNPTSDRGSRNRTRATYEIWRRTWPESLREVEY